MSDKYAPVVAFAYNRVDKIKKCIEYLEKCIEASESDLYLFCDGAKGAKDKADVERVHDFVREYESKSLFRNVIVTVQGENKGLAESIITGVTEVVNKHGVAIVVEDDLIVLPSFLKYMNEGLDYYREDLKCGSICSFTYPIKDLRYYDKDVYFTRKADCWGWATWADRWNNAEWIDTDYLSYLSNPHLRRSFERLEAGLDRLMYLQYKGKIDSWAVRWIYYLFLKGQLSVYPSKSQVINDGFDGSGTHIRRGYGSGFNASVECCEELASFKWEECFYNEEIAKKCARFPRRFLPLYMLETIRFMLKKR